MNSKSDNKLSTELPDITESGMPVVTQDLAEPVIYFLKNYPHEFNQELKNFNEVILIENPRVAILTMNTFQYLGLKNNYDNYKIPSFLYYLLYRAGKESALNCGKRGYTNSGVPELDKNLLKFYTNLFFNMDKEYGLFNYFIKKYSAHLYNKKQNPLLGITMEILLTENQSNKKELRQIYIFEYMMLEQSILELNRPQQSLEECLSKAIREEDFETAAEIIDKINRQNKIDEI
ncbi:MAG: hypothetical protein QXG00_04765 [Candidatus Woesearchaeota archaeon]